MARYQHLPIYKSCYVFSRECYRLKLKLPKMLKHDLGSEVFRSSLRCLKLIVLANGSQQKIKYLQSLLSEVEILWFYLRLLYDLRAISKGEFKVISERLADLGKQTNAWLNWEKKQTLE